MYLTLSIFFFIIFGFCVLIQKAFSTVRYTHTFLQSFYGLSILHFNLSTIWILQGIGGGGKGQDGQEVHKECGRIK